MRLMRLSLRNFKGARDVTVEPMGADLSVFATNGAGKTTLFDAYSWLLFGKDADGRADFGIKTLDAEGNALSKLEHAVEAEFETESGRITLAKVYREIHETKRGRASAEFTGHTTDHFVNDVPVAKGEYDARAARLSDPRRFRVLSDPFFFAQEMKWPERREMLLAVCGDVTVEDVVVANPDLADLPAILGERSLAEHLETLKARRRKLRPERDAIPVRIAEVDRALPPVLPGNWEAALEAARTSLADAQAFRATVASGGAMAVKTTRLQEIRGEMLTIENRLRSQPDPAREAAFAQARTLDAAVRANEADLAALDRRISGGGQDLARMDEDLAMLREEYKAESKREPAIAGQCEACGQSLPEDRIESARAAFNAARARRLDVLNDKGKPLKRRRDALAAEIAEWAAQRERTAADMARTQATRQALEVPAEGGIDPSTDPAYGSLIQARTAVEAEIAALREDSTAALADVDGQIAEARRLVEEASSHILAAKQRAGGLERIAELEAQERLLAVEAERIERETFLCEAFVRAKVSMLTDRINSRFAVARFRLFDEQVDRGLTECCEAMASAGPGLPLVPFKDLNHGGRVNVGLDIIDTLAEHFGFAPPIWVDNAESVVEPRPTRGQQVRLVVSAADKNLRFETSGDAALRPEPAGALF